jgi:hypothetical protein
LVRRLPGMEMVDAPDIRIVTSGRSTDTFNVICRAAGRSVPRCPILATLLIRRL